MTFLADDTLSSLGAAAVRGWLRFEIREHVRGLGYTPVGEVDTSWTQLSDRDAAMLNEGQPESVFALEGDGDRQLQGGDWCVRAWTRVVEDVPIAVKLAFLGWWDAWKDQAGVSHDDLADVVRTAFAERDAARKGARHGNDLPGADVRQGVRGETEDR